MRAPRLKQGTGRTALELIIVMATLAQQNSALSSYKLLSAKGQTHLMDAELTTEIYSSKGMLRLCVDDAGLEGIHKARSWTIYVRIPWVTAGLYPQTQYFKVVGRGEKSDCNQGPKESLILKRLEDR